MKIQHLIGVVIVLIFIGLGYHVISPSFINVQKDEPLPFVQENQNENPIPEIRAEESTPVNNSLVETDRKPIVGTPGHPASGTVRIVSNDGKHFVRYEDFKTINGPDIYVYIAKDLEAKEFVNLGRVKATEGNVNYELPVDINPDDYPYVLIWCKAFGVLFNYADFSK